MKITKIIPLAASLAAVLIMSGCASKSNNNASSNKDITGRAFDGPISDGRVCIDVNKNNKCESNEPFAHTDISGNFDIKNPKGVKGPLVLIGGKDTGTQKPFLGNFVAPFASKVLNPTTSAIQSLIETGVTPAEAEKTVKKALNIKSDVALTSFDPFDKIKNGNATEKTSAQEVLAAQAKLQTIVQSVATTVAGASGLNNGKPVKSVQDTMPSAFTQVAKAFQTAVGLFSSGKDFNVTAQLVSNAVKATANVVFKNDVKAKVAAKAVADSSALQAVAVADQVSKDITTATPAEAATQSNKGMLVVNMNVTVTLHTESDAARTVADGLSDAKLKEIADAQKAQEDKDAVIAAKAKAAADAETKAKVAVDVAAKADATKEEIVAAEEAKKALADAAVEKATADKAAADAKVKAVGLEKEATLITAAKVKEADLAATVAKAAQNLANEKLTVAKTAAANAKAAVDIQKALAAAKAAQDDAATTLAQAQKELEVAKEAQAKAVADAAAAAAADAKAAAEAQAQAAAAAKAKAEQEEKLANDCTAKGGIYKEGSCKMPSAVTGASN